MSFRTLNLPSGPVSPVAAALAKPQPLPQPDDAFVWAEGGRRLTPDQVAFERDIAASMMQPDYSPVGHWTQGLARVTENLTGAMRDRDALKAQDANMAADQRIAAALMGDPGDARTAAMNEGLTSQNVGEPIRGLAKMMWERDNPKPRAPHYWETNDGSLGMVGPNGQPTILYQDPTPKISWLTAQNPDGTKTLVPVGPDGPLDLGSMGAGPQQPQASGEVADFGGASSMLQALGPQGFLQWQQKHNVPVRVTSPEEMQALPPGTMVQSPDGRTAVKR